MARFVSGLVVFVFVASVHAGEPEPPQVWAEWRGPRRDGSYLGPAWPDRFKGRRKPLWRVELGASYASPVITADRVFTVETRNKQQEIVRALDRASGKQICICATGGWPAWISSRVRSPGPASDGSEGTGR